MSARIFYQEDCNLSLLDGKTIAIIGYGSQGHAYAVQKIESQLELKAFEIQGRQILTPTGQMLYRRALALVGEASDLEQAAHAIGWAVSILETAVLFDLQLLLIFHLMHLMLIQEIPRNFSKRFFVSISI